MTINSVVINKYKVQSKIFSMLSSTEHEISTAQKPKMLKIRTFLAFKLSDVALVMFINVKMPTIVGGSAVAQW